MHVDSEQFAIFWSTCKPTCIVLNPLKTSPDSRVYSGWGQWEMCVIAKSNRLQRVKHIKFYVNKEHSTQIHWYWRNCIFDFEEIQLGGKTQKIYKGKRTFSFNSEKQRSDMEWASVGRSHTDLFQVVTGDHANLCLAWGTHDVCLARVHVWMLL